MKRSPLKGVNIFRNAVNPRLLMLTALCFVSILSVSAESFAQRDAKISISYQNARLETVLKKVSELTELKFVYNNARVSEAGKVNINAKNETLDKVLNDILGAKFTYQIVDNYIVISTRQDNQNKEAASLTADDKNIDVKGKVLDVNGESLIGVSVIVKGTTTGVATDIDGNFAIKVPTNSILVFSYIGHNTKEVPATPNMKVVLEEDQTQLEEVIVVALGSKTAKASFTGSAAVIKKDALEKSQVSSISKALQGTSAGVQSVSVTGQPGEDATILIRGVGSYSASTAPLYVVDGIPYGGALNAINPADIESMTILKDASAGALYGSRGANGVIVITTKQGKKEAAPTIDVQVSYGVSDRAVKDYKKVSTDQYFELYWEALRNTREDNGKTDAAEYASSNVVSDLKINPYGSGYPEPVGRDGKVVAGAKPLWNEDWVDALSQKARRTEVLLNVSGGSKNSRYFLSAGYLDDQGIALSSGFKRYTGRLKVASDIQKWLTVGANMAVTHSVQDYPTSEDTKMSNVINFGRRMQGFYPIYERNQDDGTYILDQYGKRIIDYGSYRPSAANPKYNLLGSLPYDKSEIKRDAASIQAYLDLTLIKGLTFRSTINLDYNSRYGHDYTNPLYGGGIDNGGDVYKSNTRTTYLTFNNILRYNKVFAEDHSINLLAGQEYYEMNTSNMSGSRENMIMIGFDQPDAASQLLGFNGSADQYKLLSYFGNAEYSYKQRYFVSASVRTDGSSRFHPDNRWGTFWSVGASWRASHEEFLKNKEWLSNLTFRASYGAQGNDNLGGYYAYKALYSIYNNQGKPGVTPSRLATPELKWETNLNMNLGVDIAVLENRLSATVEFFNRRSKDLLFSMPMPFSSGFSSISKNIGAVKNVGWEFTVSGTPIKTADWTWDISINATTVKNKITKLPQSEIWSGSKKMVVGGSFYDFYLTEWAGINQENGKPQWWKIDADGNRAKTEVYNEASGTSSKVFSGSALPDLQGGFSTRVAFRGIELSALFAYTLGGKIYNSDNLSLLHTGTSPGGSWSTDMLNRWTPEHRNTDIPRLTTSTANSWTSSSTRFLVDGSYLRMKNIMVSYNLPVSLLSKVRMKGVKVYFQAENLLTVFGQKGLDPEQTVGGTTYYRYPAMKTFSFGLNIKL